MTLSLLSKRTNSDYFHGLDDGDDLLDIYEHLEEMKKNPPKSERGKRKQRFYENKLKKWNK